MKKRTYFLFVVILLFIMAFLVGYFQFNVLMVGFGLVVAIILILFEEVIRRRL